MPGPLHLKPVACSDLWGVGARKLFPLACRVVPRTVLGVNAVKQAAGVDIRGTDRGGGVDPFPGMRRPHALVLVCEQLQGRFQAIAFRAGSRGSLVPVNRSPLACPGVRGRMGF